jgi:hypothetical protein
MIVNKGKGKDKKITIILNGKWFEISEMHEGILTIISESTMTTWIDNQIIHLKQEPK